jgi:hypothetical protein
MRRTPDISVRVNENEMNKIKENMNIFGFHTLSEYIRFVALNASKVSLEIKQKND